MVVESLQCKIEDMVRRTPKGREREREREIDRERERESEESYFRVTIIDTRLS